MLKFKVYKLECGARESKHMNALVREGRKGRLD